MSNKQEFNYDEFYESWMKDNTPILFIKNPSTCYLGADYKNTHEQDSLIRKYESNLTSQIKQSSSVIRRMPPIIIPFLPK